MDRSHQSGSSVISRRQFVVSAGRLLAGGIGGGAVAALAACGAGAQTAPRSADTLRGLTIEFWQANAATHAESIAKAAVLDEFSKQTGIAVNKVYANGSAELATKVGVAMAGGTPPDLMSTWNYFTADAFAKGGLLDVESGLKGNADWTKAKAGAYPTLLKGLSWKGKLYGVPVYNSYYAMYYSRTALQRAGLPAPPKNWTRDQFMDAMRQAAKPPEVTGYDCDWTFSRTGMMSLNNGGGLINPEGTKAALDADAVLDTMEWQLSLVKSGLMRAHDGSSGGGYKELLPEQKVVFQLAVPARIPDYRKQGVDFGTCLYPLGPRNTSKTAMTQGQAYSFAAFKTGDARREQASLLAAIWNTRPQAGATYTRLAGVVPSFRYTVESAEYVAEFKKDAETWPFVELLPTFTPFPSTPAYVKIQTLVDTLLKDIWAGKTSPRDRLREGNRQVQQLLDDAQKGA